MKINKILLYNFNSFEGENKFDFTNQDGKIRNAVYTLCGLDIFELIRKYTAGYVGKSVKEDEKKYIEDYENLKQKVESLESVKSVIEQRIDEKQRELEQVETEIIELETAFKNAGGITIKERKRLAKEFEEAERVKTESLIKIKFFMEGLMLFYIVRNFNESIRKQLNAEEIKKHSRSISQAIRDIVNAQKTTTAIDCILAFSQDPIRKIEKLVLLLDKVVEDIKKVQQEVELRRKKYGNSNTSGTGNVFEKERTIIKECKDSIDRLEGMVCS